jgi:hypothetical protein
LPDFTDNSIMKNEIPSQNWRKRGKQGGGHYEKRNEKICFIRLPPDTLQNLWQVITFEEE